MKKFIAYILLSIVTFTACTDTQDESNIISDEPDGMSQITSVENSDQSNESVYIIDNSREESSYTPQNRIYNTEIVEYEYNIPQRYYSEGIKNIVRRARQIANIHWTPLSDVKGFNGDTVFEKGMEVTGIPYGQPIFSGKFIGYGATLYDFLDAIADPDSKYYTDHATYEEIAPFYSIDCSTFICYAWERPNRMIAKLLTQFGDLNGNEVNNIQVGDTLITVGDATHAVLVTGAKEDSDGNVIWVEITEATPPLTKVTRYGDGELFSIAELTKLYFDKGYKIYRNTDYRDGIKYTHSCASPLDSEYCEKCNKYQTRSDVRVTENKNRLSISCTYDSSDITSFAYTVEDENFGIEKYITRAKVTLYKTSEKSEGIINVEEGTLFTTTNKTVDKYGRRWAQTRTGGKGGWICLENCELLGGTLKTIDYKHTVALINGNTATAQLDIDENYLFDSCIVRVFAVKKDGSKTEIGKVRVNFDE